MQLKALRDDTATEMLSLLRSGKFSAQDIVRSCTQRIEQYEPQIHAFVDFDITGALQQAKQLDGKLVSGALHGISIAIKETLDVKAMRCPWGTQIHRDRVPSIDSPLVAQLRDAGAVIIGTTVSTEYAIARSGPTRNPYDYEHTPGGSSSGSAAAVAAHMVPIAIGSQTVGSIVRPSTYCGIFGFKPAKGTVSTEGSMTLSPFLDHIGPMARCVDDIILAYQIIADGPNAIRNDGDDTKKQKRVLRMEGPWAERIEAASLEALNRSQQLLEAGGNIVETYSPPSAFRDATKCWETILFRDLAVHHGEDRDKFGDQMSERFRQIVDIGRTISDQAYADAVKDAQSYREELLQLLDDRTLILAPATDGMAPVFSEQTGPSVLQGLWSLTGVPSLAVPCGRVGELPVGVQLIARPMQESMLLATGRAFERFMQTPSLH